MRKVKCGMKSAEFTCGMGRGKLRGASLRGGKVQGFTARRWVMCEAGMCEAEQTAQRYMLGAVELFINNINIYSTPNIIYQAMQDKTNETHKSCHKILMLI